jgi:hypothetical protein
MGGIKLIEKRAAIAIASTTKLAEAKRGSGFQWNLAH